MLVRDLLAYTQVTRLDVPKEDADANVALTEALENLREAIADSGAIIQYDELPLIPVHPLHLTQLFQNLISNAIKYRTAVRSPKIHITVQRDQDRNDWIFSVADNGIGIDPQYRTSIFGLFKRLLSSSEYSGTGLGLAICQRIVEQYRGRIWVESTKGLGSTFRFALPA